MELNSLQVEYSVLKSWNGGFKSEIQLTNAGTTSITDWELFFEFAPTIEDIWRAEIISQDGNSYHIGGLSYTGTLEAGETLVIRFKASGDSSSEPIFHLSNPVGEDAPAADDPGAVTQDPAEEPSDANSATPEPTEPDSGGVILELAAGSRAEDLQALIESAPAGATLRLAAGTYVFDRTVTINRDDITIEGAGAQETRIVTDFPAGGEGSAFRIAGDGLSGSYALMDDVTEGATVLRLSGSHDFSVGDFIWLERPNTEAFFAEIGDTYWLKDKPLRTSIAKVSAVDGDQLTLENGVHFDFSASDATLRKLDMAENVTLRGFTIESTLGESDPSDFSNTLNAYDRIPTVDLDGTYRATLQDIAAVDSGSTAFQFKKTLAMTADALLADGALNKGTGGNGYAYELKEVYESQLTNLEDHGMRHSVLFASWYSAANNTVEVNYTDRDINFHGGRDHGNVVVVHRSERDPAADNLSSALTYNSEGAHYGAPTDLSANTITFNQMLGSKRSDVVQGSDTGAYLDGRGGDDTLSGGLGDDTLIGGADDDLLRGGGGDDIARFSGILDDYSITLLSDGGLSVDGLDGQDKLYDVEWLEFSDGSRASAVDFGAGAISEGDFSSPIILTGSDGNDTFFVDDPSIVVDAGSGWDHVDSTVSYSLAPDTESLTLLGEAGIDGNGNDARNVLRGNVAENMLKGEGGNDDIWARGGDDRLFGGAGDDRLYGQEGADTLMGGGGEDTLEGGGGADLFRFDGAYESTLSAADLITDFSREEGDRIDLSRFDADSTVEGHQAFRYQGSQAFSGQAGELRYSDGALEGDVNGNGAADFRVVIVDILNLGTEDVLV